MEVPKEYFSLYFMPSTIFVLALYFNDATELAE